MFVRKARLWQGMQPGISTMLRASLARMSRQRPRNSHPAARPSIIHALLKISIYPIHLWNNSLFLFDKGQDTLTGQGCWS